MDVLNGAIGYWIPYTAELLETKVPLEYTSRAADFSPVSLGLPTVPGTGTMVIRYVIENYDWKINEEMPSRRLRLEKGRVYQVCSLQQTLGSERSKIERQDRRLRTRTGIVTALYRYYGCL